MLLVDWNHLLGVLILICVNIFRVSCIPSSSWSSHVLRLHLLVLDKLCHVLAVDRVGLEYLEIVFVSIEVHELIIVQVVVPLSLLGSWGKHRLLMRRNCFHTRKCSSHYPFDLLIVA